MKNVVSISQDDEVLEIASRWVLKIDAGELSASDEAALGAWLDQDESHRDVLMEVAAVWDKTVRSRTVGRAVSARVRRQSRRARSTVIRHGPNDLLLLPAWQCW